MSVPTNILWLLTVFVINNLLWLLTTNFIMNIDITVYFSFQSPSMLKKADEIKRKAIQQLASPVPNNAGKTLNNQHDFKSS